MFNFEGVWLPDGEKHLPAWMRETGLHKRDGFPTYQYSKYEAVLGLTDQRRRAVDIGAHVGQWSRIMAMDFKAVLAFEPVAAYRECWERNMLSVPNAVVFPFALGAEAGACAMRCRNPTSHGDTMVDSRLSAARTIEMRRLDEFAFQNIDLIKVDCEGYELPILKGAVETLLREKPALIVEQKPGHASAFGFGDTDAVPFLQSLGYELQAVLSGDYLFRWASATT